MFASWFRRVAHRLRGERCPECGHRVRETFCDVCGYDLVERTRTAAHQRPIA